MSRHKPGQNKREAILQAAMSILQEHGVKKLSQAKVASAAGMRQSHLTYYFPKKTDLIAGLLQQHIDSAEALLLEKKSGEKSQKIPLSLQMLVSDRTRMRFFLALIVEADDSDEIKTLLKHHTEQFSALVAAYYGREPGDTQVQEFLNTLRGFGLMNMIEADSGQQLDIELFAQKAGLVN